MQSSMYVIVLLAFITVLKSASSESGNCGERCCVNHMRVNGTCEACPPGSIGLQCLDSCPANYYGLFCETKCNCTESQRCDKTSGCVENLKVLEKEKIMNGNDDKKDGGQSGTSLDGVVIGSAIGGSMLCALIVSLLAKSSALSRCIKECTETKETIVFRPAEKSREVTHSRYINLDCLEQGRTSTLQSSRGENEGALVPYNHQKSLVMPVFNEEAFGNCNRVVIDSGEFVRMNSIPSTRMKMIYPERGNISDSMLYEEMSLIKACKQKLSSFFRRRQPSMDNSVALPSSDRFSVEMLEVRDKFLQPDPDVILEDGGEDSICVRDKSATNSRCISYRYSRVELIKRDTEEDMGSASVGTSAYKTDSNILRVSFAQVTNAVVHPFESENSFHQRESKIYEDVDTSLCLESAPFTSKEERKSFDTTYENPWEGRLYEHVQQYREVASQLQENSKGREEQETYFVMS